MHVYMYLHIYSIQYLRKHECGTKVLSYVYIQYVLNTMIGTSPTLAGRPRNFGVVNYVQTTTDKTGKLIPCHGQIHGVNYCTSLFVLCRRPCQAELHGKLENLTTGIP